MAQSWYGTVLMGAVYNHAFHSICLGNSYDFLKLGRPSKVGSQ